MELPEELLRKHEREKSREEKLKRKIKSTYEYKKRKLDKDVKKYIKQHRCLRSRDIESIGERHKFFIG